MSLRPLLVLALTSVLAACAPTTGSVNNSTEAKPLSLPPMKTFTASRPQRPTESNARLAQDFLELTFSLESGRPLDRLTRFKGPIGIKVLGNAPPTLRPDLRRLLSRLRNEAGINIYEVQENAPAQIALNVLPRAELLKFKPNAACIVVPNILTLDEYRRVRRTDAVDWTKVTERKRAAILIPGDVSPQEIRDCLHEEIAQALGPVNDLYRLPNSVFNDDNFHSVLTGFDMLMLRTYYSPRLQNGMTKSQVAAQLPAILAQLNPAGRRATTEQVQKTPRAWIDTIETARGTKSGGGRGPAAKRAVALAKAAGWTDTRTAYALYVEGRLFRKRDPELSKRAFAQSASIYRARRATQVQAAHVSMQIAAIALSEGRPNEALTIVNASLPAVAAAENAALLSTLLMIKAEALDATNRPSEARAVRIDSLGWARYGFGSEQSIRARLGEIRTLSPRSGS